MFKNQNYLKTLDCAYVKVSFMIPTSYTCTICLNFIARQVHKINYSNAGQTNFCIFDAFCIPPNRADAKVLLNPPP